jgi:hypothetical protein
LPHPAEGSLELSDPLPLTGENEQRVTYPEFHRLPDGNLLLAYRDGASGRGNLVLKHYDTRTQRWSALHDDLVSGEGQRNPYWQMAVDSRGVVHLSWVWRESPDVASNHDLGYAKSSDGGKTWQRSDGSRYALPITAATAEYAMRIPQQSELINQTSMCADARGRPYIATYWRPAGSQVPQYMVVHHDGSSWQASQVTRRTAPFSLSGGGTKRIPISRPQIVAAPAGARSRIFVIFRDEERGNRVSVAATDDLSRGWTCRTSPRVAGLVGAQLRHGVVGAREAASPVRPERRPGRRRDAREPAAAACLGPRVEAEMTSYRSSPGAAQPVLLRVTIDDAISPVRPKLPMIRS